ncbi:MAG TPA: metallophosphoesterase [Thermoanaerobaculia bacterium]|nr:metallophosphoesterase [Thermoanaerobaculia bacterium]
MKKVVAVFLLAGSLSAAGAEKFLSVSDIHFNPFADPSLVAKLETADVSEWESIFASSASTAFSPAGSDVNDALFRSAMAQMKKQIPSPAFVLISGDFLAHKFDKTYQSLATDKSHDAYMAFVGKTIAYVASAFRKAYPGVRVYPTLGNNDSDCGDYAVAPNSAFLRNFANTWKDTVVSRSFDRRFPAGGYYHVDVPSLRGVRVIALNTNFFSTNYSNPCGTPGPDPGLRELEWLDAELDLARVEHKRVWLLFHIPPGMDVYDTVTYGGACPNVKAQTFWKDDYAQKYLRIASAHRNTILGSWAGHTHQDEFRFAGGDFIHIAPSISPVFGNNPAFEVVEVERDGAVVDYTAYHLPAVALPWSREYAFDEEYGKRAYDLATLTQLAASIHDDTTTRAKYFAHTSSEQAQQSQEALAQWEGYWCGFTKMYVPDYLKCACN